MGEGESSRGTFAGACLAGAVFGLCIVLGTFLVGGSGESGVPERTDPLTVSVSPER